jgi:hypothetical protein
VLGWLRGLFLPCPMLPAKPAAALPTRWPEEMQLLSHWAQVEASLYQERAVVFISVEWAVQERHSRRTFAEFARRTAREHPELAVWFGCDTRVSLKLCCSS